MAQPKNSLLRHWWKILCVILLVNTVVAGLLVKIPNLPALEETSRNLFFHVSMWMCMMTLFTLSVINSIRYLFTLNLKYDIYSRQYALTGIFFGLLGYVTGAIWMSYTWADPNTPGFEFNAIAREPKLIGAAVALLIYAAYLVLRDSINDMDKRARTSAVYNIFAYAMLFPTIWIVPRLLPSLHPGGQEGNPAMNFRDISPEMRIVELPAFIGWTLLGVWITTLRIRLNILKEKTMLP